MDEWNTKDLDDEFDNYKVDDYDNEDEDEVDLTHNNELIKKLDDDLIEYFDEAKIIIKKPLNKSKIKKKDKGIYSIGQKVKVSNRIGSILYGPYEKNSLIMYEIETDNGIISIEERCIKKL